MKKLIILVLILAAGGAGAGFYYMRQAPKEPEVRTAQITRGDIIESVQATGTLEAVTTVEVGTQVGGVIQELYADFNDIVKKGQVIARLDPTILDTQIEQQKANVTRSEADLERLKVTLADSKQKLERARALSAKSLLAKTELDTAEVNVQSAEAQIKSSEAGLVQAKSQLNTAVVNRDHTVITAPIDGIVIERAVEPGQTVNAGMSAPKLFVLAADLTKMQVNANIDEADVGKIRPGQVVGFRVDAFANQSFTGAVQQVRLKPTTVQNVVTYQAIIHVPNLDYKLKPGMTASPLNIEINHRTDVLRIPTAAIRYRPTNETFAALKQEVPADFGRGGGRNARGGGPGGGGPGGPGGFGAPGAGAAPSAAPAAAPAAKSAAPEKSAPTQQANAAPQGARQPEGSPAEARGGGDRMGGGNGGGNGRGQGGGGRGGFDPNMTPEERQKRMEERMAAMTPEERQAFQERMAARGQGRGGFGGGQGQGGGQGGRGGGFAPGGPGGGPGGGRGGVGQGGQNGQNGRQSAQNGGGQGMRPGAPAGRVASTPSITGGATTIDSLFGPLPVVETRGSAWLFQEKKLKMVRVRLGVSDSTWTEILEGEGLKEGTDVVTNVIIETAQTPGGNNSNNPLMGPQRGRPGGQGGFGGPGGGGGGRGGGRG